MFSRENSLRSAEGKRGAFRLRGKLKRKENIPIAPGRIVYHLDWKQAERRESFEEGVLSQRSWRNLFIIRFFERFVYRGKKNISKGSGVKAFAKEKEMVAIRMEYRMIHK